jgi:long-chain fatty acid transport protein
MKKIIILSIATSALVVAGGYKVPEQSLNSMALGAAYVAHTKGADSAYFNPANMAFLDKNNQFMEAGLTLAHLPSNTFDGIQAFSATEFYPANGHSKVENLLLPYLHYVSKPLDNNLRWGASLTVPGGLTKQWDSPYQRLFAQEFTLKIIEFNPVIAYKINDQFALGGGARIIYSEGKVYGDGSQTSKPIKREMEGDTIEYGYNLAMTYRPTNEINIAATYRSNIDLKEEGEANLYIGGVGKQFGADVTVPLPAALNLAISKTWEDRFTLEFNYERTYWSSYEQLDFNYNKTIQSQLISAFDDPKTRDWKDTDTFRVGATLTMDRVTYMMGFAIDESPISTQYLGYELPDSDAKIFSMGVRFQASDQLSYGLAYLHDEKESITLDAGESESGIIGKFSGGGADLLTASVAYKF